MGVGEVLSTMSNSSAHDTPRVDPIRSGWRAARRTAETVGFWSAVALPFLYLPLMVAGPQSRAEWLSVGALVCLHVLALVVGHAHNR
jgi:hypothetical protein